jgi:hypothetical protein
MGAAETPFLRLLDAEFGDGKTALVFNNILFLSNFSRYH